MSIKTVELEIARFLSSEEPEVLCISGAWGVGKTFTWMKNVKDAAEISLPQYSYVSLFGQNSLQDVRNSIFENARSTTVEKKEAARSRAEELAKRISRGLARYRPALRGFVPDGAIAFSERFLFATMQPQIVCLDDLERAGDQLSKKDILGLANQLKEEKKCKVVLLLNSEALGDDQSEFNRQIEKVADVVLEFEPTPEEAAEIGISEDAPLPELIRQHTQNLGIRNIRTIKRVEAVCGRLAEHLVDFDERILRQAIHTAALFVFIKFQPEDAPSRQFVLEYNHIAIGEDEDDHPEWRSLLTDYEFGHVDEFDFAVAEGVSSGFLNREMLRKFADQLARSLTLQDQDSSFQKAWDRYHYSFDDDQDEVLDQMAAAFERCVESISPLNAAGTAQFFKDLGRSQQSRTLAEFYVENRDEPQEFWDLENSLFGSEIRDEDIRELFRTKYESFEPPLEDPAQILIRINKQSGWNQRDIDRLAELTEDEFFEMLKTPQGRDLTRITTEIMRFRNRGAEGSKERTIFDRGNNALERISGESLINARRVRHHRKHS